MSKLRPTLMCEKDRFRAHFAWITKFKRLSYA
ncbi:MAG: hypothetical protein AVDCRST_MAG86-1688 [uncultured Truepera sp.]|uniref:Uncharacterized protein n=1 Tax=uncultured Truepera sp. TaxID=543023 RepID=A0A6J4VDT0_9DEIN|nr:MAG: hypothetical protein AVDCRST_MAG86-1688 [uncultured Truepera sp.]